MKMVQVSWFRGQKRRADTIVDLFAGQAVTIGLCSRLTFLSGPSSSGRANLVNIDEDNKQLSAPRLRAEKTNKERSNR
ncbi:hypothetical protein EYF80_042785 [Liparis tanakae]|uniref:Uncharacterized protein n=1 Tax=Liparis tanakae TaxID=230148 RepID=A0A4Z2G2D8_9TELE|nr:hypothetical protein EYF80_042785 [Liparis tanakae]